MKRIGLENPVERFYNVNKFKYHRTVNPMTIDEETREELKKFYQN